MDIRSFSKEDLRRLSKRSGLLSPDGAIVVPPSLMALEKSSSAATICDLSPDGVLLENGVDPITKKPGMKCAGAQTIGQKAEDSPKRKPRREKQLVLPAGMNVEIPKNSSPAQQALRLAVGLLGMEMHEMPKKWSEVWLSFQDNTLDNMGLSPTKSPGDVESASARAELHEHAANKWQLDVLQKLRAHVLKGKERIKKEKEKIASENSSLLGSITASLNASQTGWNRGARASIGLDWVTLEGLRAPPPLKVETQWVPEFQEQFDMAEFALKKIANAVTVLQHPSAADKPKVLEGYTQEQLQQVAADLRQWLGQLATVMSLYHVHLLDLDTERSQLDGKLKQTEKELELSKAREKHALSEKERLKMRGKERKLERDLGDKIGIDIGDPNPLIYSQADVDELIAKFKDETEEPLLADIKALEEKKQDLYDVLGEKDKLLRDLRKQLRGEKQKSANTPADGVCIVGEHHWHLPKHVENLLVSSLNSIADKCQQQNLAAAIRKITTLIAPSDDSTGATDWRHKMYDASQKKLHRNYSGDAEVDYDAEYKEEERKHQEQQEKERQKAEMLKKRFEGLGGPDMSMTGDDILRMFGDQVPEKAQPQAVETKAAEQKSIRRLQKKTRTGQYKDGEDTAGDDGKESAGKGAAAAASAAATVAAAGGDGAAVAAAVAEAATSTGGSGAAAAAAAAQVAAKAGGSGAAVAAAAAAAVQEHSKDSAGQGAATAASAAATVAAAGGDGAAVAAAVAKAATSAGGTGAAAAAAAAQEAANAGGSGSAVAAAAAAAAQEHSREDDEQDQPKEKKTGKLTSDELASELQDIMAEVHAMEVPQASAGGGPMSEEQRAARKAAADAFTPAIQEMSDFAAALKSSPGSSRIAGLVGWTIDVLQKAKASLEPDSASGPPVFPPPPLWDINSVQTRTATVQTDPGGGISQEELDILRKQWQEKLQGQVDNLQTKLLASQDECRAATAKVSELMQRLAEESAAADKALKELRAKLQKMQKVMQAKGLTGDQARDVFEDCGLSDFMTKARNWNVFERLYHDAMDRVRRLAELQAKIYEKTSEQYLRNISDFMSTPHFMMPGIEPAAFPGSSTVMAEGKPKRRLIEDIKPRLPAYEQPPAPGIEKLDHVLGGIDAESRKASKGHLVKGPTQARHDSQVRVPQGEPEISMSIGSVSMLTADIDETMEGLHLGAAAQILSPSKMPGGLAAGEFLPQLGGPGRSRAIESDEQGTSSRSPKVHTHITAGYEVVCSYPIMKADAVSPGSTKPAAPSPVQRDPPPPKASRKLQKPGLYGSRSTPNLPQNTPTPGPSVPRLLVQTVASV